MTQDDGTLREVEGAVGGLDSQTSNETRNDLEAYHDRELAWWRRRLLEGRLRRSPQLRRELEMLGEMRTAAVAAEEGVFSPDLWGDISSRLGAIDAARRGRGAPEAAGLRDPSSWLSRGLSGLLGWKPVGLAVAAGAAALAIGLWNTSGTAPADPNGGVLRYLDTGGASVLVVDDVDVTIIWLMEGGGGSDGV